MPEVLPSNALSAEALRCFCQGGHNETGTTLTLRMASRSLVTYARTTLMATRRPSYVPRDTSAKPPHSTSTEFSEQSGMSMDVGITRCRLHVLQSSLNNFNRSRSDSAPSSRRCGSCQPWGGGMWKRLPDSFHRPASVLLILSFVETGRKRQYVGGSSQVAAVGWGERMRGR